MYALKTYWWDKATEDDIDNEIDMFENAGRHNNLVQYFGVVNDPVRRCLRLELCLDRTLNDLLKRRGKLIEEVRYIGTGIAAGLAYLHKEGLIHCDVKTKNILFSPSMVVKVGDLGLSESFKPRMPCTDKVGTPGWIAPEVLKREAHTLAIDVFSFGLMMFKMLEGHQPILTWWEKHEIYPKELEVSMFEVLMSANAKDLVGRLLDFNPSVRPKLNRMNREKFFITGRCPSALNQSIFDEEPNFKAIKRKSSSQSRKEERPKAKHDAASH
ncbi:Inactive serine/threonine-protein kinase plk5 [Mortierella sp. AD031]|nr:Inactive serine/threonine-protein kinase plk5 [Mortierella sp. AD031]